MPSAVLLKLASIVLVIVVGYVAGRQRWLGPAPRRDGAAAGEASDPARVLSNAAFYVFIPALLFRTTARVDFRTLPWRTLAAFFVPAVALMLAVYLWQRLRGAARARSLAPRADAMQVNAAGPSVRAMSATFGNSVQVGIPLASALFGEAGLSIHVTIVSLHALTLLTLSTALAELDLAREARTHESQRAALVGTLARTARSTVVHPVTLPVLLGLLWNALRLPLPSFADEVLLLLSQAVVPLCLVLIGLSLSYYGMSGLRAALAMSLLKLFVLPALVLGMALALGLSGLPLAVVSMMAALPAGSNALIFAQRYRALEAETTATLVLSTLVFVASAPFWLWVTSRF
jgi:malonate transporter and related proteins